MLRSGVRGKLADNAHINRSSVAYAAVDFGARIATTHESSGSKAPSPCGSALRRDANHDFAMIPDGQSGLGRHKKAARADEPPGGFEKTKTNSGHNVQQAASRTGEPSISGGRAGRSSTLGSGRSARPTVMAMMAVMRLLEFGESLLRGTQVARLQRLGEGIYRIVWIG